MKILYQPFGLVISLLAGILARKVFDLIWTRIDDEEPPGPTTQEAPWPKLLGATAVQGLVFALTKMAVNRGGARTFEYFTGFWPGEKKPDPKD